MAELETEHPALVALRELEEQIDGHIDDLNRTITITEARLAFAKEMHVKVKEAIDSCVPCEPQEPAPRYPATPRLFNLDERVFVNITDGADVIPGFPSSFEANVMSFDGNDTYRVRASGVEYDVHMKYVSALGVSLQPDKPVFCPDCGTQLFLLNGNVAYCNACTAWLRANRPQSAKEVSFKPGDLVDSPDKAKLLQKPSGPPWPHAWPCPHCRKHSARSFVGGKGYYGCLPCHWKESAGERADAQLPEPNF